MSAELETKPHHIPTAPQLEWSIQRFYEKSWDLVKKQPILWLFGLASLIFSASSGNFNSGSSSSSKDKDSSPSMEKNAPVKKGVEGFLMRTPVKAIYKLVESKDQQESVLGVQTQRSDSSMVVPKAKTTNPVVEMLFAQFSQVPVQVYLLLVVEVFAALVFGLVIAVVGMTWSEAALYKAFEDLDKGIKTSITRISTRAVAYIKPAFKYNLLSVVVGFGFMFIAIIVIGVVIAVASAFGALLGGLGSLLFGLAVIGLFIATVYFAFKVITALSWGRLFLFLDNTGARGALDRGWQLSKAKSSNRRTFKLLLANVIISAIFGFLALLPLAILVVIPVITMIVTKHFSFWVIPFFIAALLIGFPVMMFINSLVRSVTFGTWYFAFPVMKNSEKTTV